MKPIDVKEQPRLGFRRTLEISLHGIRHRLFRTAVTMAVIAVAIAFMMNVVCEALAYPAVGRVARAETKARRLAVHWLAKLTVTATRESLLAELAALPAGDPLLAELARQGKLRSGEVDVVRQAAAQATAYLAFFEQAGYARRRLLVGAVEGTALFGRLHDPRLLAEFARELDTQKTLRLPGGMDAFRGFLATWPAVAARLDTLVTGRRTACERALAGLAGEPALRALRRADGEAGAALRAAGFPTLDATSAPVVAAQAREELILRELENSLQQPDLRQRVATRLDIAPHQVTGGTLWTLLRRPDTAGWYLAQLAKGPAPLEEPLSAAAAVALARRQTETRAWEAALLVTRDARGGLLGAGTRMAWLVAVSLLVCAVGISNAMLMTVTERFREIATLKCLGALDEFILQLFLLEACVLGLTGGLLGAVAGSAIGFGRMSVQFGGLLTAAFPWPAWLASLGAAVLAGVAVAAAAGVYPASVASRLAPLEAMRVE